MSNGYSVQYQPPKSYTRPATNGKQSVNLNPAAGQFKLSHNFTNGSQHKNGAMEHTSNGQVKGTSPMFIMEKIQALESSHTGIRSDVEELKAFCNGVYSDVEKLKGRDWPMTVGPFQDQALAHTDKAEDFRRKLDQLKLETVKPSSGTNIDKKANGNVMTPPSSTASLPPHLRGKVPGQSTASVSSERRIAVGKGVLGSLNGPNGTKPPQDANNPLATDGYVDPSTHISNGTGRRQIPEPELTSPPTSPATEATSFHPDIPRPSIEDPYHATSGTGWMPLYTRKLSPIHPTVASFIPPPPEMVTFSADFLRNTFGGAEWSPGLNFVAPTPEGTPCMLPSRTYYTMDMRYEPYLPKQPGEHGAKLTPFFRSNPEEEHDVEEETLENVPMFVMTPDTVAKGRYVYFGNYSQTRWSDKIDYDRMVEHVPHKVKEYWAEELSAVGRAEWLTEQLKKHFFPKPEYEGRLFSSKGSGVESIAREEEAEQDAEVKKDVKAYVQELKVWDKDASMKVKMIKKESILQAFEEADIDDPPGLRLWWEYLQCVHWNKELYELLVTLQGRNPTYFK